jgi:uncharacterized damage-inducible protein DinB
MKAFFIQYAQYSRWAHQRLIGVIQSLNEEQQHREIASSFSSLYKTLFHVWTAETAWWQRLHGGQSMIKDDPFHGLIHPLADDLLAKDQHWADWISSSTDAFFLEDVAYKNLKGDSFVEPMYQILLHLFNHSTYHNGQIVTLFHHLGVEKIPATDFIVWARENKLK